MRRSSSSWSSSSSWVVCFFAACHAASSAEDVVVYAVLAEESQMHHLDAASCSWFQFARDVIVVTERESRMKDLACAVSGVRRVEVRSLVDLTHVARRLATVVSRSRWVLMVQAYTLVRPKKLAFLLRTKADEFGVYAGFVRNASDLPYLGYLPHAAHEFGILQCRNQV